MTDANTQHVTVEVRDYYLQEFDEPHQPLSAPKAGSHISASVTFRIGSLDVAAWAKRNQGFMDLNGWIQLLGSIPWDLQNPDSRHVAFADEAQEALVFHRRGASLRIQARGQPLAVCSYAELLAAVEAGLGSIRAKLETLGEWGHLYWTDAFDVLDPGWKGLDDEAFFASRHSWMFGPCFESRLRCPDPEAVAQALMARPECHRCPPMKSCGQRWVCSVPDLEHRVGFLFGGSIPSISFPPRQVERACRLPEADASTLWPHLPCPTPQARAFLRWLVGLIQQLSAGAQIDSAVLVEEGSGDPACGGESGWVYVYRWAGIGEPTSDPEYNRVPLSRR